MPFGLSSAITRMDVGCNSKFISLPRKFVGNNDDNHDDDNDDDDGDDGDNGNDTNNDNDDDNDDSDDERPRTPFQLLKSHSHPSRFN